MSSLRFAVVLCTLPFAAVVAVAAEEHPVVLLWSAGAPGFENKKDIPEKITGTNVSGIHNPSITVYLPKPENATGAAVIVAPGGGHQRLAIQHEGYNVAQWLADHGVAAFILKYRLSKDDTATAGTSPYSIDVHELADAQRAIRLIRSRAKEWQIDPARVGIVGFSAGGEVALLTATRPEEGKADASDVIEQQGSRPNFFALIYPGGMGRTDISISKEATPPVFLACGYQDRKDISEGLAEFYLKCKRAGVEAEFHVYAGAGHGFGVRDTNKSPSAGWTERFREWMNDRGFFGKPKL